jgi:uncharacterized membrane protein HdeD (DUF308 family)
MGNSNIKLWKIVRISGVTAVLFGLYYLFLPPAESSALVETLQHAAPDQQFVLAYDGLSSLLWTIGAIQIFHGVVVIVCSSKGLKRAMSPP